MGKIIRCECCNGRKRIIGLGGMQRDCYECDGVGHLELIDESRVSDKHTELSEETRETKKRGRKPKTQAQHGEE